MNRFQIDDMKIEEEQNNLEANVSTFHSPISVLISVMPWTLSMSASSELGSGLHPKTSDEALRLLARVLLLLRGVVDVPLVNTVEGDAPRWWYVPEIDPRW